MGRSDPQSLTVMVTRPSPDGERVCSHIEQAGFQAVFFPTIQICAPVHLKPMQKQLSELDQYDWVVFISPQSVYKSAAVIHRAWPLFPVQVKVAAMGPGTAHALVQEKLPVDFFPTENCCTEGLLDCGPFQKIKGHRIALVEGENPRPLLKQELQAHGAKVTEIIVYRRIMPELDASPYQSLLRNNKIDLIICTSKEALLNLKLLLGQVSWGSMQNVPLLVGSNRMQMFARKLGFQAIFLAKNPGLSAMIEFLKMEKETLCKLKQIRH